MHILGNDIAAVQKTGGHVLAVARVALHHLVVGLEARHGDLLHRVGFVGRFGSGDDRCVGHEREVDTRVRHQVGLELVEIDIERTIETERGGDRGHDWQNFSDRPYIFHKCTYLEQSDG